MNFAGVEAEVTTTQRSLNGNFPDAGHTELDGVVGIHQISLDNER